MSSVIILTARLASAGVTLEPSTAPDGNGAVMVDSLSPGLRVVGSSVGVIIGAGLTALTGSVSAILIGQAIGGWNGLGAAVLTALGIWSVGYVFLGSFGAWLGQRIAGGQAWYGWAIVGALAGAVVGGLLIYFGLEPKFHLAAASEALTVVGIVAALVGPVVAVELSHQHEILSRVSVSIAPLHEGGAVAVGLRF